MASNLEVSIPSTSTSATAKPYTIYTVNVKQPLRSYTLPKRYSDFVTLHAALTSEAGNVAPPAPLPQKSWFKSTISSPQLTEDRRRGLEQYLQAVVSADDSRWRGCSSWRTFLHLPSSSSESSKGSEKAASTAAKAAELQNAIAEPTVWLDTHRDLKTVLRDARSHLARRDQANTAQEQHEAASEAKRCLVRSGTMILALEGGLKIMSGSTGSAASSNQKSEKSHDDAPATLGTGELQRRKALLLSAKSEREGLDNLLNTSASKFSNSNTDVKDSGTALGSSRSEGKSNASSKGAAVGRRVLGGPAPKETEQTRELDNDGLLQLQKQVMQQQDQDIGDLTMVVQRMKAMGTQINEELTEQNQMLDLMEQDVERVQGKVDISKKRLQKIK